LSLGYPKTASTPQLLASHIILNGRLQLGDLIMGAVMRASLILRKASRPSLEKMNGVSLAKSKVRGLGF